MAARTLSAAQFELDAVLVASLVDGGVRELDAALVANASVGLVLGANQIEAIDTADPVIPAPKQPQSLVLHATSVMTELDADQWACMGHLYPLQTRPPGSRTLVVAGENRTLEVAAP